MEEAGEADEEAGPSVVEAQVENDSLALFALLALEQVTAVWLGTRMEARRCALAYVSEVGPIWPAEQGQAGRVAEAG